jgi:phenylacetate-CoA ligase
LAYEQLADTLHRMKVLDAVAWPEAVEHESGSTELVFTALRNEAMPLVRYQTGDLARLTEDADGWHVSELQGRVHDLVYIGESAYPTHYMQDVFDRLGGIDEFQFQQRDQGRLTVRMVVPDASRHAVITSQLSQWWGDAVTVEFCDFDGLRRTGWRGKFRHLVDEKTEGERAA